MLELSINSKEHPTKSVKYESPPEEPRVSKYTLPDTYCGEAAGSAGINGLGKLMTSKTTVGASEFSEGSAKAYGNTVLSTESGVGPDFESIVCENTHSNGVSSGHIKEPTDVNPDGTTEPVES